VQSPPQVVEKHIVHKYSKPRHHFRKTAYVGGYIGGQDIAPVPPQQVIDRRMDFDIHQAPYAGAAANVGAGVNGNVGQTYTKQVAFQRNPNFFADIFNVSHNSDRDKVNSNRNYNPVIINMA
jgi:hypothetical protein